jgi:hypothetical protein
MYKMGALKEGEKKKKATGAEGSDIILYYLRMLPYPRATSSALY